MTLDREIVWEHQGPGFRVGLTADRRLFAEWLWGGDEGPSDLLTEPLAVVEADALRVRLAAPVRVPEDGAEGAVAAHEQLLMEILATCRGRVAGEPRRSSYRGIVNAIEPHLKRHAPAVLARLDELTVGEVRVPVEARGEASSERKCGLPGCNLPSGPAHGDRCCGYPKCDCDSDEGCLSPSGARAHLGQINALRPPAPVSEEPEAEWECETCEGTGDRFGRSEFGPKYGDKIPCRDCRGSGRASEPKAEEDGAC